LNYSSLAIWLDFLSRNFIGGGKIKGLDRQRSLYSSKRERFMIQRH
jgi:hypothetical protein